MKFPESNLEQQKAERIGRYLMLGFGAVAVVGVLLVLLLSNSAGKQASRETGDSTKQFSDELMTQLFTIKELDEDTYDAICELDNQDSQIPNYYTKQYDQETEGMIKEYPAAIDALVSEIVNDLPEYRSDDWRGEVKAVTVHPFTFKSPVSNPKEVKNVPGFPGPLLERLPENAVLVRFAAESKTTSFFDFVPTAVFQAYIDVCNLNAFIRKKEATTTVKVSVRDIATNEPIAGADIRVDKQMSSDKPRSLTTDETGAATFDLTTSLGSYRSSDIYPWTITADGYYGIEGTISTNDKIQAGKLNQEIDVRLIPRRGIMYPEAALAAAKETTEFKQWRSHAEEKILESRRSDPLAKYMREEALEKVELLDQYTYIDFIYEPPVWKIPLLVHEVDCERIGAARLSEECFFGAKIDLESGAFSRWSAEEARSYTPGAFGLNYFTKNKTCRDLLESRHTYCY